MESSKSDQTDEQLELGNDLLGEICSRMPAKAAIKVSSLSKSLTGLLSDPLFVESQSIRSSLFDGGFFLRFLKPTKKLEFHVLHNRDSSSLGIQCKSLSFIQQFGRILDSSQGLLLIKSEPDVVGVPNRFLICNPATGSCCMLPVPEMPLKSRSFLANELLLVCHPRDLETHSTPNCFASDYTIIAPLYGTLDWSPSMSEFAVYRNGKWDQDTRFINIEGRQLRVDMPVALFTGRDRALVLHYLCDSEANMWGPTFEEPCMMAYDVERKAFSRRFELPKDSWDPSEDYDAGSYLMMIFRCAGEKMWLARTDKGFVRVWVLEDYDGGRWRRMLCKTPMDMGVPMHEPDVLGCCVVNGTGLLFATWRRVYLYEMDGPRASTLEVVAEHGGHLSRKLVFTPYANTLRPVSQHEGRLCDFCVPDP